MRGLLLVLLVTSCSYFGTEDDQATPDAYTGDASPTSVQVACESGGTTFPFLEKGCVAATDCFVAEHMHNCCGTQIAVGLNKSAQAAFTQAEAACSMAYPGCGCAQFPTTAEDGRSETDGTIQVRCDSGLCTTFVQ